MKLLLIEISRITKTLLEMPRKRNSSRKTPLDQKLLSTKNSSRPKTPLDQKLLSKKNSSRPKTPLDQKLLSKKNSSRPKIVLEKTPLEKTPLDLETLEKIPSSLMCENNSNEFIKHLFCFVLIYIAVGSRQHMLQGVTSHPFPYPPPGDAFGCRCKLLFGKGSEEPHPQKPHIPNAKFLVIAPAPGSSKQL